MRYYKQIKAELERIDYPYVTLCVTQSINGIVTEKRHVRLQWLEHQYNDYAGSDELRLELDCEVEEVFRI